MLSNLRERSPGPMNAYRKNAIVAGALLLTALVAGILSVPFLSTLNEPDYLVEVAENESLVIIGVLLQTIMAFACAGIAIWLYPALKKFDEAMSLGSVGFRIIEAVIFIVAAISVLTVLTLSHDYRDAGPADAAYFQTMGSLLLAVRDWASNVLAVFSFGLGALMYYIIFYRSRLVPRWLSVWGLIAIILHMFSGLMVIFAVIGPFSAAQGVLSIPIASQELVLAVWLITIGFNRVFSSEV
ncbi:MAG: DUF4386 domain-containing protein [Actinobacteria bacterium]|nr:DUF4386 domain-containing protein [Actinomycetota bacterium]